MSRSRCRLHKSKLGEFAGWLESIGWNQEKTKGDYEVLRMRNSGYKDPLIVYDRNVAPEHYTTFGISDKFFSKFNRVKHER